MLFGRNLRRLAATGGALTLAVSLAACASSASGDAGPGPAGDQKDLTLAYGSGWAEAEAVSYLWKDLLESEGYDVTVKSGDIGVVYTALAGGDYDLTVAAWLPNTHAAYLEQYGDDVSDQGVWYDQARITIAVNEDSPAKTIGDLKTYADDYGNKLVGIEAGAGQTKITKDVVVPTYGLDDLDYTISSTPAMLAELQGAIDQGNDIAVTLWRPHWAYDEFPVRDLEDPEGTLGGAEEIHNWGTKDFSERYPQASTWFQAFEMDDEQLFSLQNLMFNDPEHTDDPEGAVDAWLEQNPDFFDDLKAAATA
ncbi:glycine betaine ABC transporter substrate-binding protein [Krasilnikoviella flava]|uniref:Glycine betaine/proline transport system substrate-binding protein n=1 Tax=Krasilnikoviella flava TaxID=526729 RepID=A0A1T5I9V8_9MICO|nr:glycine betaine ABC transporter substrate-binding protein [Krasilnikoviella flava]SKC35818.1 glycine betaine/proline transport system substrate-binding protein [Krasilnikoviella flava]